MIAQKPIWNIGEYTFANGKRKGRVFETTISELAQFYSSPVVTGYNPNLQQYADHVSRFVFPQEKIALARQMARRLANIFQNEFDTYPERDHTRGKIDPRKLPQVSRELLMGTYDRNKTRPYQQNVDQEVRKPVIAITSRATLAAIAGYPEFVQTVSVIALGIAWACKAAGLEAHCVLGAMNTTNPHYGGYAPPGYDEELFAVKLAAPDRNISLNHYAVLFKDSLYKAAFLTAIDADERLYEMLRSNGYRWSSGQKNRVDTATAGHSVSYVRQSCNADIVVALGPYFSDHTLANVHLPNVHMSDYIYLVDPDTRRILGRQKHIYKSDTFQEVIDQIVVEVKKFKAAQRPG